MLRLSACGLALVVSIVGSQSARAQAPRYPRIQPAPPPVELSDRVKPAQPAQAAAATASPKPTVEVTTLLNLEYPVGAIRPEQEQILVQLIANTPDSEVDEKSDYYFRLAGLYSQQLRFWLTKATEAQARVTASPNDPKLKSEQSSATNQAKTYLLKAVKSYKGLTDNDAFRNYPKMDLALFQYGFALQSGKYMKEARQVYDKLLKNYPNSAMVPYAHLVFAEYYFESGQLADAESRYKQVTKFPKSSAYWYARYKLGWINLSLQKNIEAIDELAAVVYGTRNDSKQKYLHDAAKHDFVYAYAAVGKMDKAFEAFGRLDKDAAVELVVALAEHQRDTGNVAKAATAFHDLAERAPDDGRACLWQYEAAHLMLSVPTATTVERIAAIEQLVAAHVKERTAATAAGKTEDFVCRDNAMAMSGELAVAYHNEWSKTFNIETLGYAERLYTVYVNMVPGAVPQRAALAEALWSHAVVEPNAKQRSAAWERAATAFMAVGTDDANRAAGLAWLNAVDYVAPTDGKLLVSRAPGAKPRALPLKGRDIQLVAALQTFLTTWSPEPQLKNAQPTESERVRTENANDEVAQMRMLLAVTLRKYKHHDEAVDVLDRFLADFPSHPSAELAANLLLDSLVQARSEDLPVVVSGMLADTPFVTGKNQLLANLTKLRRR